MNIIIVFVYLGLQFKWNHLNSNNSRHTSCIHKRLHAGKWPELMTSKPDSVSTLKNHWTYYTGTTLANAITQWCPSGNPVLICIAETHWKTLEGHWKTTGSTLETHWLPTILSPVTSQCSMTSKFQAHWIAAGLPLNYHWLRLRDTTDAVKWTNDCIDDLKATPWLHPFCYIFFLCLYAELGVQVGNKFGSHTLVHMNVHTSRHKNKHIYHI